jgi:hypothetical protein
MSNIFTRNLLRDLLNEETSDNNYALPQYINIIDKKNTNTFISSYMPQIGGNNTKNVSSSSTEDDVNQLISMLTSESDDSMKFSANSTQTEVLENRLKNMTFNGGGMKKIKQKGGANPEKIKEACKLLEEAGYTFSIKDQNCEKYLENNSPNEFMKNFNLFNIFSKSSESTPKQNKESNPSTSSFNPGTIYDTETSTSKKNSAKESNIKNFFETSDAKSTNSTSSFLPTLASPNKMSATSMSDTKSVNSTSTFLPTISASKLSATSLSSATSIPNASETENRTLFDSAVDMVKDVTKSISKVYIGDSDTSLTSTQNNIVKSFPLSPTSTEKPAIQIGGAKKSKKKTSKKTSKKSSNKKKGKKMSGGGKKKSTKKNSNKKQKKSSKN